MNELAKAFREFVNQETGNGLLVAQVTSVNEDDYVFDCEDLEGVQLFDVRMNATPGETGLLCVPQIGATVLILDLSGMGQDYVMIHAGTVSKVIVAASGPTRTIFGDKNIELGQYQQDKAVLGEAMNANLDNLLIQLNALVTALEIMGVTQLAAAQGPLAAFAPGFAALAAPLANVKGQLSIINQQFVNHISETVKIAR